MATKVQAAATKTFSAEEREAMEERARETKRAKSGKADGEADLLAKIAEMQGNDKAMAERIHAIVKANAPNLSSKTWYGMPAYANTQGKVVCFFKAAAKFQGRYAELGFNDPAQLDDGNMWPSVFALMKVGPAEEKQIAALVKRAAGA